MPTLEGLAYNTETIQMYYSFDVSRYEIESQKAIPVREILRGFIAKGVIEICAECTRQRYYIVGLGRPGEIIQKASPELNDMSPKSYDITYNLILELYVRRFATRLTGDELYYWSKQSSERILFEMNELESRTFSDGQSLFVESNPSTVSNSKVTVEQLNDMRRWIEQTTGVDTRKFLAVDPAVTGAARSIEKFESEKREQLKNEVQQYTIIRRPKCLNQNS